jgi:hypothetical protein
VSTTILPYCEIDGIPTLKDSELAHLFDMIHDQGVLPVVFYDRTVTDRAGFVREMKRRDTWPFVVYGGDDEIMAIFWLNTFEGRSARIHFCGFPAIHGKAVQVARECLFRTLTMQAHGGYVLDTLVGVTPVDNKLAIRMLTRAGMVGIGVVPGMLDNAYTHQPMDALVSYATRKEFS